MAMIEPRLYKIFLFFVNFFIIDHVIAYPAGLRFPTTGQSYEQRF